MGQVTGRVVLKQCAENQPVISDPGEFFNTAVCIRRRPHKPLVAKHSIRVGGKTCSRQARTVDAAFGSMARVVGFGHGAEIGFDAASVRGGEPHGRSIGRFIQIQEVRHRSSRTKHPVSRRRMPAARVMIGAHRMTDTPFDFDPNNERGQHGFAGRANLFCDSEHRRQYRCSRMAECARPGVVIVQRMPAGTVQKRRGRCFQHQV